MTHLLLEQCHRVNVGRFAFVSSSTVYGEAPRLTAEDHAPLKPIGVYGASKLIREGSVSTYAHSHRVTAHVLRFANIVGARSRGVVIPDFIKKLRADSETLTMLWNGRQEKPYTHVDDCVHAMRYVVDHSDRGPVHTYNLGTETTTSVNEIAETVADVLDVNLAFEYTGGTRGLAGDIPKIRLAISKLLETDWEQDHRSNAAVRRATEELARDL